MATCSVIDASSPDISEKVQKEGKEITVNFGVFFDGTNNQRLQVAMGKLNREILKKKKKRLRRT